MHRVDQADIFDEITNPLDSVEDVLSANEWAFSRMNMDELIVQVAGKSCNYRLIFVWQEEMNAIQFCCQYDMSITEHNMNTAARTLMSINANLWMGHFTLDAETRNPTFRHTHLNHGGTTHAACFENIEALIDIALTQCERYQAAFKMLSETAAQDNMPMIDDGIMSLALMETLGES